MNTTGLSSEAQEALARFRALYVRHPRAESAEQQLLGSLERALYDHHLTVFVGPTGVGKTRVLDRLSARFDGEAEDDPSPDRVGAVRVRLEPHGGAYHPARLDRLILQGLDEPLIDRKVILPGDAAAHLSYRGTNEARRRAVLNALRIRRPRMLAVDEAQHLSYLSGRGIQQALDDFKTIVDNSAVPLLFCGSYELLGFTRLSAQLTRRSEVVAFDCYTGMAGDWRDFLRVLKHIAATASFDFDPLAKEDAHRLYAGSIGCVGLLVNWVGKALEHALEAGRSAIERPDLAATAWGYGDLRQMLEEAQAGEAAMRAIAGERAGLYEALGLVKKPAPQRRRVVGRPGQRKPVRDVIGDAREGTPSMAGDG